MEAVLCLLIGLLAGVSGGFFGIGGGVVIVPAMVLLLKSSQQKAQGTSFAALLLPVGIFAVLEYNKEKSVDFVAAGLIALGFLVGGYFGAKIAVQVDELMLRRIFAGFLVLLAVQLVLKK